MGKSSLKGPSVTGTATATDTATITGNSDVASTSPGALVVVVMYNDSYATNPVTSVDVDGVTLNFQAAATSGTLNVSVEAWMVDCAQYSGTPTTITVHFGTGASLTIFADAFVVQQVSNRIGPIGAVASTNGTTSPATQSMTWDSPTVNANGTVGSPAECGMMIGCVCAYRSTSAMTLSLSSGTGIVNPTDVGSGVTRITCAIARVDATGGSDTISWSQSVNREWVHLMFEMAPTQISAPIQCGAPIPTYY